MSCSARSTKGSAFAQSFHHFSSIQTKLGRLLTLVASLLGIGLMLIKPEAAWAQKPLGIDVSSYQGSAQTPPTSINWASVKGAGYTYAWAKATEGEYDNDGDYVANITHGKSAGIYMGSYDFCRPDLYSPTSEAQFFWNAAGGYILADGLTLMPMLDFETFNGFTGSTTYADWANQWCSFVTNKAALNGVYIKPEIYTSACTAGHLDSSVTSWYAHIADYNGEDPQTGTPWSTCTQDAVWGAGVWNMWQYTSSGSVPGITGRVDMDVYNGSSSGLFNQWVAYSIAGGGTFYYWDPQGTSGANPYTGSMTGSWEGADWAIGGTGYNGQASPVTWVEGKCAIIGVHTGSTTPAFTITMNNSHTVAGFFDGGLNGVLGGNVTLNGAGIISMAAGAQGMDVPNSYDIFTISNTIAGTGQVVPEGAGSLYLNGTNSYTGGTQLGYAGNGFTGTLYFNNNSSFGPGSIVSSNGFGCTLQLNSSSAVTIPNTFVAPAGANNVNFVGNPAGLTFSGPWILNGSMVIGSGGAANNLVTISGAIAGGGFLWKTNAGILALSGNGSYTGTTTISTGTLNVTGAGKLGNGSYAANITNNATFVYSSTAAQTFSGIISGTGSLTVSNAGTVTLSGIANTYSGGTTVSYGATVNITSDASLGAATGSLILNGGCLKNNNSSPTLTASRTITLGANGGYFDAGFAPANPITISSKLTGPGALLINLDGSPVVLANTANSYTGGTIVGTNGPGYYAPGAQAWLKMGASNVLPNGVGKGNTAIFAAYKGLLDLAGTTQTINGLNGDGTINNSTGSGALSVGNNNQSGTFNGPIQNSGGTLTLTKIGAGTLTLNGTNTYSGNTTISAGTLALGATGSINNTPTISIAAGATLDASAISSYTLGSSTTLIAAGTASPATINGGTTVSLGSRPIVLTFDGTHPALSVAQGQLVLNGNAFTVNGPVLSPGTYTLIQQASGTVAASGAFTVAGTAIGAGSTGVISVSGGNVNLIIKLATSFSGLTASPTVIYGTPSVTLSGKVSANGPTYPAAGETVTVTINGNAQNTTINDATGDFSFAYNLAAIPVRTNAYAITYSYAGNTSMNASSDASKTLTVNPLAAFLAGSRIFDGTANAAASILSVSNKVGSDVVTVASGSGTLSGTNVGTQTITSFGNLALGGAAAGNYTLIGASGSVKITSASYSISAAAMDSTGSNFIITWASTPGSTYQVISSTNVAVPMNLWTNVGGPIVASNTVTSATNPVTSATAVYNVKGQ